MIKEIKNILLEMENNFFIFNLGHGFYLKHQLKMYLS